MDEELVKMLKFLRLGGLLANWDHFLKLAGKGNFSHARLLKHILEEEYKTRMENSRKLRIKRARIIEELVIETYPFQRQPGLNKKKVLALYDSDYIEKNQNIIWIGPTGVGKTGLASAFLINSINRGHKGRFIVFPELINILYRARADHSEERVIKQFLSYDCLVIDEIGYVEIESIQVGLFFTLLHRRHKKKATLITSNLGFSEWSSFLKNDHLAAALIDRLTENSHVINMKKCVSIRQTMKPDAKC